MVKRLHLLARWAIAVCVVATSLPLAAESAPPPAPADVVNVRGGSWSDPEIWRPRGTPRPGTRVRIAAETTVEYDVVSERELGAVEIEGTLTFSRIRSTRLDAGPIIVRKGGALELGSRARPIPSTVTAEIRLVVPEGRTFEGGDFTLADVGLWVFPGGRWELYGSFIRTTWAKLAQPAAVGASTVTVDGDLSDWPRGADLVITPTMTTPTAEDFEERRVAAVRRLADARSQLTLTAPLRRAHGGGNQFSGEVALLSRNVRIMSKYTNRTKAHTMFMAGARGSIAYAEFRDLGPLGVLARYPIHFHQMGETSRGMSVRGASIWRSDNHFVNIHGSNGVIVEDTVGYDAAGSGFFIEPAEPTPGRQGRKEEDGTKPDTAVPSSPNRSAGQDKGARSKPPRKGEDASVNLDVVLIHNLAAKGFWRPGSLDEPHRVSLFWIASFNAIVIDNVAVGSRGGKLASGFHLGGHVSGVSRTAPPLAMVHNEAHGNGAYGLFSWTNAKLPFDVVGFRAWRNGKAGLGLGAYNNRFRIIGAELSENVEHNATVWLIRAQIQDSTLTGSKIGIFFTEHPVGSDPQAPAQIVNTRFSQHSYADVSQDHRRCPVLEQERLPDSKRCPANYALFARPQFSSSRPIDFGWQENANSWLEVIDWAARPAGLPPSFRVVREDQEGEGKPFALFGGRIRPAQRAWDYPPVVAIALSRPRSTSGAGLTIRAAARDDRGIVAVEFLVDGVVRQRLTRPPFEISLSAAAGASRSYVYARAMDGGGNVAYSQVLRVPPAAP
jgi:cell migration-inducing and hyaluronan-binding protein